ncbi:hypothetical protein ACFQT0_24570 [Hymenobacter humi]|uniref:Uncharacterized protein n=1 Tax=Hymenobacter humi TaxID=1411620 RepID=A0ABW2U9I0_9BACT
MGLKNGMVYNAFDVEMKTPLFGRSYLLLDGQRRFDINEVGFYEDESGHYVRTTLPNSQRETTLRRDKTGRISLYSITTRSTAPGPAGLATPVMAATAAMAWAASEATRTGATAPSKPNTSRKTTAPSKA